MNLPAMPEVVLCIGVFRSHSGNNGKVPGGNKKDKLPESGLSFVVARTRIELVIHP